jgi:hypothetical protein
MNRIEGKSKKAKGKGQKVKDRKTFFTFYFLLFTLFGGGYGTCKMASFFNWSVGVMGVRGRARSSCGDATIAGIGTRLYDCIG